MKIQKKTLFFGIILTSVLAILLLTGTITAQSIGEDLRSMLDGVIQFFKELFGVSEVPVQKLLLAALLTMIVYSIVKDMFGQTEGLSWAIAIVIAILSMIGISQELISSLAIQYGAMGAAMLTIIPLAIMMLFTLSIKNGMISKLSWLFYVIYYFSLYIGAGITNTLKNGFFTSANGYYLLAMGVGIFMFFFESSLKSWLFGETLKSQEQKAILEGEILGSFRRAKLKEAKSEGFG